MLVLAKTFIMRFVCIYAGLRLFLLAAIVAPWSFSFMVSSEPRLVIACWTREPPKLGAAANPGKQHNTGAWFSFLFCWTSHIMVNNLHILIFMLILHDYSWCRGDCGNYSGRFRKGRWIHARINLWRMTECRPLFQVAMFREVQKNDNLHVFFFRFFTGASL